MTAYPDAELVEAIVRRFFAGPGQRLVVEAAMTAVPLVVATAARSTATFTAGQRLYVHDGYWGANERVRVVGRYRMRHRFVRGVFPVAGLAHCRPRIVHHPAVIRRLAGEAVDGSLFLGIGGLPVYFVPDGERPFADFRRAVLRAAPPGGPGGAGTVR